MLFNVCFVLGGPGAGKGTVCQKMVDDHGFIHLSAGELLRKACETPNSPYREEIQEHMKNGTIVPAKVTCGLLHQAMVDGFKNSGCTNYLIDGFPRNNDNRTCWEEDMSSRTTLQRVIVLDCPDEVCVQRCMGRGLGRIDDNQETLQRRLRQFKEQCLPVIQFYETKNLVSHIDSSVSREEVFIQLKKIMDQLHL